MKKNKHRVTEIQREKILSELSASVLKKNKHRVTEIQREKILSELSASVLNNKNIMTNYNDLTSKIIAAAIEVHKELGPGLLESVYEECLFQELIERKIFVQRQVRIPVIYKGRELSKEFFLDLLIDDSIIIELKAVEQINPIHEVQLVTYLKLSGKKLGLLINFHEVLLKNGIRRKINGNIDN